MNPSTSHAENLRFTHGMAVGYVVFLYLSSFVLEVFIVIPFLFGNTPFFYLHMSAYLYCMANIAGYYYKTVKCDVSCEQTPLSPRVPVESSSACFFCHDCQMNSPGRAHHCNLCGKCIDRRDHHCYFIANCIGLANLRYFIVLNVFAGIMSIYSVTINVVYLSRTAIPLSPLTVDGIMTLIPVVTFYKWFVGTIALYYMLVVMVTWLGLVQILISFLCGFFQMRLLWTGQTTYEYSHNIHTYDKGWRLNYQEVCGRFWLLRWLLPLPSMRSFVCNDRSEDTYTVWEEDGPRKVL
ncbi:palmitoyltransferase ZDHHC22-like [Nematostella vectensis]|uniref:palmitoyltransferase ZDHHC22-like n=1 Tax=Nematostella vectensis TaxID=45351 RepID=UPI0020775B82|nr:palmitoyltransferase ZDHHC22-like [Nematostella vectensis]